MRTRRREPTGFPGAGSAPDARGCPGRAGGRQGSIGGARAGDGPERAPPRAAAAFARLVRAAVLGAVAPALAAQSFSVAPHWDRPSGYVALQQAVRDAGNDRLVLIAASHPDDRYVMPAAYLRFAHGWRVAVLLFTRGEGGQNSRGSEVGDELGWLRTLEAEAAAAFLDCRLFYLNRQDAGYSRTAEEALEVWGADTVVDVARIIRRTRPDLVLTPHHPGEEHGHDQALLRVLPAAIALAADAGAMHPRLRDLPPVRVTKAFREATPEERDLVRDVLPMETFDRVRGESYRRIAYTALRMHRSQAPFRSIEDLFDPVVTLFPLIPEQRTRPHGWTLEGGYDDLFDAAEAAAADGDPALGAGLEQALADLAHHLGEPAILVRRAVELAARLHGIEPGGDLEVSVRRDRRLDALHRIIRHGAPLRVSAEVEDGATAIAGRPFPFVLRVHRGSAARLRDLRLEAASPGTVETAADPGLLARLPADETFAVPVRFRPPVEASARRAWLEDLFRRDTWQPPVELEARATVLGEDGQPSFDLSFPVPVPVDVRPAVELEVTPAAVLLPRATEAQRISLRVTKNTPKPVDALLEIIGPPGFVVVGSPVQVRMEELEHQDFAFELRVPRRLDPGVYNLHVSFGAQRAVVPVHRIDVSVPPTSVGLIRGVDDTAETMLRAFFGERLDVLGPDDLALRDLDDFDTIVVDIRALGAQTAGETWRAGRAAFPRLLDFVERGGRLVVFYHKDTEFNVEDAGFKGGPYPLRIGKGRVTREDAPVEVLEPDHPLLEYPNEIEAEDWDGWVQERGLYFPESYHEAYEEILVMGDPGRPRLPSALLYARYGNGEYVYCALALYRQLNSLHPGACRLFANLVSR